jgi:hypothetical protein
MRIALHTEVITNDLMKNLSTGVLILLLTDHCTTVLPTAIQIADLTGLWSETLKGSQLPGEMTATGIPVEMSAEMNALPTITVVNVRHLIVAMNARPLTVEMNVRALIVPGPGSLRTEDMQNQTHTIKIVRSMVSPALIRVKGALRIPVTIMATQTAPKEETKIRDIQNLPQDPTPKVTLLHPANQGLQEIQDPMEIQEASQLTEANRETTPTNPDRVVLRNHHLVTVHQNLRMLLLLPLKWKAKSVSINLLPTQEFVHAAKLTN